MEEIKQQIILVFRQVMMNKVETLDIKTSNYWFNAISKKQKSLEDFKHFISRSQDYKNLVKSTFIDAFCERMAGIDYQEFYDEFTIQLDHKMGDLTIDDIYKFIHSTHAFEEKYTRCIIDVYTAIKETPPSLNTIQRYLHKFQDDKEYNIVNLQKEISVEDEENDHDIDVIELNSLKRDQVALLEFYKKAKERFNDMRESSRSDPTNLNQNESIEVVDIFETVYGRNMNVREYFLYRDLIFNNVSHEQIIEKTSELKKKHDETFKLVVDLNHRYLNKTVDENIFIKEYLKNINNSDFMENLKMTVIASEEYKDKMCSRLCHLFNTMYDEELSQSDVLYIFANVRNKAFDLQDEEINNFLVEYKNETDAITERIFSIFIDTYEREPDMSEVSHYLEVYRVDVFKTQEEIDDLIQEQLYESLEYHDVIKKKIREIYFTIKKQNILPSLVYTVLQKVLPITDKKNIDKHIEKVLIEM